MPKTAMFYGLHWCILFSACFFVSQSKPGYWLLGQILFGLFCIQSFILLHEFGHASYFKKKAWNRIPGHIAGFASLIPFYNWKEIHKLHHQWTGWRDLDPTTEKTFYALLSPLSRRVANLSWRLWIPLFSVGYRIGIYWNLQKLKNHLSEENYLKAKRSLFIHLFLYGLMGVFFWSQLSYFVAGYILGLMGTELIILSQHSHVPMPISRDLLQDYSLLVIPLPVAKPPPVSAKKQIEYTRSIRLPRWFAQSLLFNVNLHQAHHAYPNKNCLELTPEMESTEYNTPFWTWLRNAKAMTGACYVFKTFNDSKGRHF